MTKNYLLFIFTATGIWIACNSKPEVIQPESTGSSSPIFKDVVTPTSSGAQPTMSSTAGAPHKVTALETLQTDKYTYVKVKENESEYWIAISKREVQTGKDYIFTGGLMKKNFESREFNRVFETLYLVSDFRAEGETGAGHSHTHAGDVKPPENLQHAPGAVKIADLIANLKKYENKSVKVTGKVVKLNPMIMGRNWLHIQDGSGKNADLTITTSENVHLGDIVTMEGTLSVGKDFGAGYRYDYILESAVIK